MNQKQTTLYNMIFPIWMLFLFPYFPTWLIMLAGNFLIDSLVLALAMGCLHYQDRKQVWKSSILKIWIFGFLSDILGALIVFGLYIVCDGLKGFPLDQVMALPGVLAAGVLIYFLNRFSFKRTQLEAGQIHKLCLSLAVFTAPYTMLIPVEWLH